MRGVEVGRLGRKEKREDARLRKRGLWSEEALGDGRGDGGVKEYDVELGEDGEFKVVH